MGGGGELFFSKPLKEISFGRVLLRLFQTSRRFNIQVQPQLVLLQKTLLNIEGLGRDLDPELDLWASAKRFLERWMSEQVGWRGLLRRVRVEAPNWSTLLPEIPRLVHRYLNDTSNQQLQQKMLLLVNEQKQQTVLLAAIALLLTALLAALVWASLF